MTLQEFLNRYNYDPQKDCIGEGGFGSVYKAYDKVLDREVAIKISAVRNISGKTFSLKTECETALSLPPHPNIAQYESVYSFQLPTGMSDFAVIQFYPEGSLKNLIEKNSLSYEQKLKLLEALLDGLEHLHTHHIIHRDLKPSNILIAKRMRGEDCVYIPKIADFGLSKVIDGQHSHVSSSFAGGTLEYSSPEQLKGQPLYYNSDLWSWAVIAYEVLTGEKLFRAPSSSSAYSEGGIIDLIFNVGIESKLVQLEESWRGRLLCCLEREPQSRVLDVASLRGLPDMSQNTIVIETENKEPIDSSKNTVRVIYLGSEEPKKSWATRIWEDFTQTRPNLSSYLVLTLVMLGGWMSYLQWIDKWGDHIGYHWVHSFDWSWLGLAMAGYYVLWALVLLMYVTQSEKIWKGLAAILSTIYFSVYLTASWSVMNDFLCKLYVGDHILFIGAVINIISFIRRATIKPQ